MYSFHYDFILPKYGDQAKLLFTDIDSPTYEIKTTDIYEDLSSNTDLFDTSDYPKELKL